MRRLIEHLKYGLMYHGDAKRDTIDKLEEMETLTQKIDSMEESISEAIAATPEEDFFDELMDVLIAAKDAKTKAEKQELIEEAIALTDQLTNDLSNNTEYIIEMLRG